MPLYEFVIVTSWIQFWKKVHDIQLIHFLQLSEWLILSQKDQARDPTKWPDLDLQVKAGLTSSRNATIVPER